MIQNRAPAAKIALLYALLAVTALVATACAGGSDSAASLPRPSAVATATAVRATPTRLPPSPTATALPSPTPAPPPATPCGPAAVVVARGDVSLPVVLLTFDAEGDAGYVAQILATLRAEGVKAGFAVSGSWAERYPDLVRAIAAEGHSLYNHSYDHPSFTGRSGRGAALSREERIGQLQRTEEIVVSLTGQSTKPYFRPPYGDFDSSVLCDIYAAGYPYLLLWNVDMAGFKGTSVDQIVATALANARPGAIYVMHTYSRSNDALALPRIIQGLRAMGYQFGTLQK